MIMRREKKNMSKGVLAVVSGFSGAGMMTVHFLSLLLPGNRVKVK